MGFDYKVRFKKGVDNVAADDLSWIQEGGTLMHSTVVTMTTELATRIVAIWSVDTTLKAIIDAL